MQVEGFQRVIVLCTLSRGRGQNKSDLLIRTKTGVLFSKNNRIILSLNLFQDFYGMCELSSLPGIPSATHLNINVLGYFMSTIQPPEPYILLGNTLKGITSYFSFTIRKTCLACLKRDRVLLGGCHRPPNSPNR